MVSTRGNHLVDGAERQQEHAVSSQGCSSLPMDSSTWQELEQHEISAGSQQDTPAAVLIVQ